MKRVFWKIWVGHKWCGNSFAVHRVRDQIDGWLYIGVTVFGWSIVYSDFSEVKAVKYAVAAIIAPMLSATDYARPAPCP